ncbi:LCP family protein [Amycolatopsis albispora]|uniref:LCP family protein n=1 Tax=Amycolatopsis albispora TaxID=1804986 RepID=UPI0013B39943|nr:LCP family protein [Amycolatopsis albispora]
MGDQEDNNEQDSGTPVSEPSGQSGADEPSGSSTSDEKAPAKRKFVPSPVPRTKPVEPEPEQEPEPEPEAEAVPRRRKPIRTTGKVFLALLSVVALAATGYAYTTLDDFQDNVGTADALIVDPDDPAAPPADDGATDILLVGADSRTDMQGNPLPLRVLKELRTEEKAGVNTDTLIILRIPKNGGKPAAVSIPRDTWIDVPQGGQAKINSVYGVTKSNTADELRRQGKRDNAEVERESDQAGRTALVKTVQDFTQIRIDHYAEVGLLGFYLLTEALGGIKVCLNNATEDKDSGANFPKGVQTVSGGEALSFVRQRKNLPGGDLGRIQRQQAFLSSALHQVLSAGTLTSPDKLNQLMDAVKKSIVVDPGLDLLEFAGQAKDIASGEINFQTIPVVAVGARSDDGQSIIVVDLNAVRQFVAGLVGRGEPAAGGGSAPGAAPRQNESDGVTCVD